MLALALPYSLIRGVCYDRGVKPLKLHFKTTLLVSAITLAVMIALLLVISARLVDFIRADEKALTEVGAVSLAEHLGQSPSLSDSNELERATALVRAARRDAIGVRLWKAAGDGFNVVWSSSGGQAATEMPAGVAGSLGRKQIARIESGRVIETSDSLYRVFAPIVRQQKVIGAVEIDDHLDNLPVLLKRSASAAAWLAFAAIGLIALATYVLFRDLIYRPIENLLEVIAKAKSGKLDAQAPERKPDELGRLSQEFNGMLGQIHEMTAERERRQEVLRERVHEATVQLEQRNQQLETANQELWRTTRRLTQLERLAAAGQTAAQFAHEVGTPLGLISCQAQLIQSEAQADPASVNERAEIIVEQAERIERIVRRTLDRTRGEIAEHSPLDLNSLINRITEATLPTLAERGVRLDLSLDRRTPVITGDADKLQQAFLNLINNALDSMSDGGQMTITTAIEAPAKDQPPRVVVTIADTGCGMTVEAQARIFDPLYTTKERGKGTGLGLAVVNQVMQEHDGAIEVESAPGRGSRFRLLFPKLASTHMAAPDDRLSQTAPV